MPEVTFNKPHRRFNPLTGEWVLVSPQRTQRPWQGKREKRVEDQRPPYESHCYLCPGNVRANGKTNDNYSSTFVFPNDFSALLPNKNTVKDNLDPLLKSQNVQGECRVICFSPRHDLTLPEMKVADIIQVIELWQEQISELGHKYVWVQVFENKGDIMGCSNPHPHGQIWAGSFLPTEAEKENHSQQVYYKKNQSSLLFDYLKKELLLKERIVLENDHWVTLVPFWAIWPYETMLLPKQNMGQLTGLSAEETSSLADILKRLLCKYDNLFETSFPYSMGWHGAPFNKQENPHWQLHAHFYPPLLRSATVKKFMVGYEILAESQRDITAETAAEMLRKLPDDHYKQRGANV